MPHMHVRLLRDIRFHALLVLFCVLPSLAHAALSIDGQNSLDGSNAITPRQPTITLSTSKTNDVIVFFESNETDDGPNPPATISTISDTAGLVWHKRVATSSPHMIGFNFDGNNSPVGFAEELWWAYTPAALSSDTISPTFVGGTVDASALITFGINGASTSTPWDTNGALPQLATNASPTHVGGVDAAPAVSGISTDIANTLVLGFMGTPYNGVDDTFAPFTAGSGYTLLSYQQGGANADRESDAGAEYKFVSSAQSNTTVAFAPPAQGWIMIGDAIQQAPPDTTPPVITLNGASSITLTQGDSFSDPGASALDAHDGVVTVTTTGSVNTSVAGTYTLTYTATDAALNAASATRQVVVQPKPDGGMIVASGPAAPSSVGTLGSPPSRPQTVYPDGHIVYHDLPSPNTPNTTPPPTSAGAPAAASIDIPQNHALWDTGDDIRQLQIFLNAQGFIVAPSGPGSPGSEITIFGPKTYRALIQFQRANGLPATGYFGPLTRALMSASH